MRKVALYRKYRPVKLSEVIGQDHITTVLEAAIKAGGVSHAYLLTGQRGTGKTSVARILAHEINQIPYTQESFDIIEIDAASHGLKENIKELIEKSVIAPIKDKYKVYIIDEVHSMKHDAFNTFLKLLEEPPQHVVFILATTDPQKLPPTILSRAQRYHFRPVKPDSVVKHLQNIAQQEKIDIDDDAVRVVAERGEGSFRDSISLLDQLSSLGGKIDVATVENILGLASESKINSLVGAVVAKDSATVIATLNELKEAGLAGRTVVDQLVKKLLGEATNHPELFGLIDKLVDSVAAFDIYLKLLAVLATEASSGEKPAAATPLLAEPVAPTISETLPEIIVEQKAKPVEPKLAEKPSKPETLAEPSKPETPTKPTSPRPTELNWDDFTAAVTKLNRTCGSCLGNASHDYDGEILTLYFKSNIFRAKMQDSKWKGVLKAALAELYDTPPIIEIAEGQKPKNATLAAVADIMGGGEAL